MQSSEMVVGYAAHYISTPAAGRAEAAERFSRGSASGETSEFWVRRFPAVRLSLGPLRFRRDGGGLGELKRQPRPGGELGIVFVFLGGALGLVFVRRATRVGFQVAVDSIDDHGRENHLQLVTLYLADAARDLSTSRKYGLSVHLDGACETGRERITPVILVAGEGLVDHRGDLCAFWQGDEVECLRRVGGIASRVDRRGFGGSAPSS